MMVHCSVNSTDANLLKMIANDTPSRMFAPSKKEADGLKEAPYWITPPYSKSVVFFANVDCEKMLTSSYRMKNTACNTEVMCHMYVMLDLAPVFVSCLENEDTERSAILNSTREMGRPSHYREDTSCDRSKHLTLGNTVFKNK
jgi:hypothetical protein